MPSTAGPSDPESRRDHLRRAISRITTTFRRADEHKKDLIPGSVSFASLALPALPIQSGCSSMDALASGPSRLVNEPLIADSDKPLIADPDDTLLAAGSSQVHNAPLIAASDDAFLDPRYPVRGNLVAGEWTLDRASAHNDRAQRLMSRYGVNLQLADTVPENAPSVVRRVQRAPRMRVQRTCHECGADFSQHKKCKSCGHDICKRCPRVAGRRPESVMVQEEMPSQAAGGNQVAEAGLSKSAEERQALTSDLISRSVGIGSTQKGEGQAIATVGSMHLNQKPQATPARSLESDNEGPRERRWKRKGRLLEPDSRIGVGSGPSALPTAQDPDLTSSEHFSRRNMPPRRTSNKSVTARLEPLSDPPVTQNLAQIPVSSPRPLQMNAERWPLPDIASQPRDDTPALPVGLQALGSGPEPFNIDSLLQPGDVMADSPPSSLTRYARSNSSLMYLSVFAADGPQERALGPSSIKNGQQKMFPAVERVYRKPRQRIRYMCHECKIPLLQAQTCSKCGHQRCELCRRRPTLKVRRDPDPRYVEAVERRLAAIHNSMTSAAEHARAAQTAGTGEE